jgi:uncharacterized protein (TIGR00369 family)
MTDDPHFRSLERMYLAAPINAFYRPSIEIQEGGAVIEMAVSDKLFHAAGAVHGSVYFKMLDDAAFFAANSLEREFFVLTTSFTTYFTRPVSEGSVRATGTVVHHGKSQILAEAVVLDGRGREIGRGNGVFMRSRLRLSDLEGYGP